MPSTTPPAGISYQDYLDTQNVISRLAAANPSTSESGNATYAPPTPLSPEQWNALSPTDRLIQMSGGAGIMAPGTPLYDRLSRLAGSDPNGVRNNNNYLVVIPADKYQTLTPEQMRQQFVDPSKLVLDPASQMYVTSSTNRTPQAQALDNASGLSDRGWVIVTVGLLAGGAAVGAAYGAASPLSGVIGPGAATTGTTGADTTALNSAFSGPGSTDLASNVGSGITDPAAGVTGSGAVPPAVPTEVPTPLTPTPTPTATPTLPAGTPTPTPVVDAAPPTLPPGTQAPAPVVNATPALPGATPTGDGIINSAINPARNVASGAMDWFNNLSPASRLVLGTALSRGMQGLSAASAQRQANQAAVEAEQRRRADLIRRSNVSAFTGDPFTPKPGIIGSALMPPPPPPPAGG